MLHDNAVDFNSKKKPILVFMTDINKRDEKKKHTALMYAIEAKQFECVDRLFLKIPNIDVCYSKERGQTCLMWAIEQDLDQTAEKLLSVMNIIDINKKDKSETTAFNSLQTANQSRALPARGLCARRSRSSPRRLSTAQ